MDIEGLRQKLLVLRKGSAFKESPVKIIDIDTGSIFEIKDVVYSPFDRGTTYIKVKKGPT